MKKAAERQVSNRKRSLKQAVGYVRVSTAKQGKNGMSLELQREAIKEFASHAGYHLVEIFEDVATGKGEDSTYKRKGLKAALDLANREDADLVVWDWSRLSRYSQIEKQVASVLPDLDRVVCVRERNTFREASETATHFRNERFAAVLSRRTKEGMAKKREQGVTFGNPEITTSVQPSGVAANTAAADKLAHAIAEVLRGLEDPFGCSLKKVADVLNKTGLRTRRHKEWNASRARQPVMRARQLLKQEAAGAPDGAMCYSNDPRFGAF